MLNYSESITSGTVRINFDSINILRFSLSGGINYERFLKIFAVRNKGIMKMGG